MSNVLMSSERPDAKPLLMASDAEYLRGLSVGGGHLVSAGWLCDFAKRIENTLAQLYAHPDSPGGPWDEMKAARILHDIITDAPAVWDELTDDKRLGWRIDVRNFWYALNKVDRLKGGADGRELD